jgi:hypothetical protein
LSGKLSAGNRDEQNRHLVTTAPPPGDRRHGAVEVPGHLDLGGALPDLLDGERPHLQREDDAVRVHLQLHLVLDGLPGAFWPVPGVVERLVVRNVGEPGKLLLDGELLLDLGLVGGVDGGDPIRLDDGFSRRLFRFIGRKFRFIGRKFRFIIRNFLRALERFRNGVLLLGCTEVVDELKSI